MKFGPVTPEIEVWEICTFETIQQKATYLTECLNNFWTDLHQCLALVHVDTYGEYKTYTSFTLVQGTRCYGNQLIFGDFCRRQNWLSSLFALVLWKETHHRLAGYVH